MDTLQPPDNRMLQDAWNVHKEGGLDHAGKIYEMLAEKYPGFQPVLNALGTMLLDMGRIEQAEKYFQKTGRSFDCIYSSGCLVYFGNIQPVFSKVSGHMTPGATFAFSVEELKEDAGETDFKIFKFTP